MNRQIMATSFIRIDGDEPSALVNVVMPLAVGLPEQLG
jgi:hypothetical protein